MPDLIYYVIYYQNYPGAQITPVNYTTFSFSLLSCPKYGVGGSVLLMEKEENGDSANEPVCTHTEEGREKEREREREINCKSTYKLYCTKYST